MKVIDSHIHCGVENVNLPFELIKGYLAEGEIQGACFYAPVEDIYDRYDYNFEDNYSWMACRQRANRYLLDIQKSNKDIFAYFFVWNDFRKKELMRGYKGLSGIVMKMNRFIIMMILGVRNFCRRYIIISCR